MTAGRRPMQVRESTLTTRRLRAGEPRFPRSRRGTWALGGVACALLVALTGCHDPLYAAKQRERQARIQHWLHDFAQREDGRPAQRALLIEWEEDLRRTRAKHLEWVSEVIERDHAYRRRMMAGEGILTRERLRGELEGDPERIAPTFRALAY